MRVAIATSSAGLAWARGYPDGNALPVDRLLSAVREIAASISVPLSVDIEGGYSIDPEAVGETVAKLMDAGGGRHQYRGRLRPSRDAVRKNYYSKEIGIVFWDRPVH